MVSTGSLDHPHLGVTLRGGEIDRGAKAQSQSALKRLLGLGTDLSGFEAMAAEDPFLNGLVARMRGLRPPRYPTVFEGLVNGVAGQQISLDVCIHLISRLAAAYGQTVAGVPDGLHAFPGPAELAAADPAELKGLGFSLAKARTIVTSARAVVDGTLDLDALEEAEDAEVLERLTGIHGVGRWTAQYVMLRGLGRLHIFPGNDAGARNKLKEVLGLDEQLDYDGVESVVSRWQPYGGLVYLHLMVDSLSQSGRLDQVGRP